MTEKTQLILLPAGFKQFRILKSKYILDGKNILAIGANSEKIAEKMIEAKAKAVSIIVDDYDSLLVSRMNLQKESKVIIKMMDFENTDFLDSEFDLVYAQASISLNNRNKIVKEIKRILKPEGVLCVSEITLLREDYPAFVKNIFDSSDILPLINDKCKDYYLERNFLLLYEEDLTSSLRIFYEKMSAELKSRITLLSEQEKSYYKKILNKISHESNAYLKLGADKYIGLKMLILRKTN
ncbi:MAG: class I SAM-dependent methyltransferase [Ignavibacteriaceae bacterium]|nr:class I SAM-dependent methyltransferase [Ignavibacteriaceae bacterium]